MHHRRVKLLKKKGSQSVISSVKASSVLLPGKGMIKTSDASGRHFHVLASHMNWSFSLMCIVHTSII